MRQGAFFKDEIVRMTDDVPEGGSYQPLGESDPDYKLYKSVQAKIAEAMNLKQRVDDLKDLQKSAEEKGDRQTEAGYDAELEKMKSEYDAIRSFVDKSHE